MWFINWTSRHKRFREGLLRHVPGFYKSCGINTHADCLRKIDAQEQPDERRLVETMLPLRNADYAQQVAGARAALLHCRSEHFLKLSAEDIVAGMELYRQHRALTVPAKRRRTRARYSTA